MQRVCLITSIAVLSATPMLKAAPQATESARVTLPGNLHPMARAEFDRGPAPASLRLDRVLMVLRRTPKQQRDLDKFLIDIETPTSLQYHRWLTPSDFGRHFGPPVTEVRALTVWLETQGLESVHLSAGRTTIEFSGTVDRIETALGTPIHKFVVGGEEYWANTSDPSLPAPLAANVHGFVGLNNFERRKPAPLQAPATLTLRPLHDVPNPPPAHAIAPGDFATIYDINPLYQAGLTGAGITIAAINDSNLAIQDIVDFRCEMGLVANPPELIFDGSPGAVTDDEPTLDSSWAGAVAPEASIKVVISADTVAAAGLDLSELYAVDNNIADIITESYFYCEPKLTPVHLEQLSAIREQAAAQGITWVVSASDNGAYGCLDFHSYTEFPLNPSDPRDTMEAVNGLASSPYVVAVGGTQFNDTASPMLYWNASDGPDFVSALSYIPEVAWNQSCGSGVPYSDGTTNNILAGSGGPSSYYPKPTWQAGIPGMPADGHRDLPDLAFTDSSAHDPYLLCNGKCVPGDASNIISHAGGTSAATPAFAGIMALVDQSQGGRQGAVNSMLYGLAASQVGTPQCNSSNVLPSSTCAFHDVTSGNTVLAGSNTTDYPATPGYDLATGLGSVDAMNLIQQWNGSKLPGIAAFSPTPPLFTTQESPIAFQVSIAAGAAGPAPTGTVTFYDNYDGDGGVAIGTPAEVSSSKSTPTQVTAALTTSSLSIGNHSIFAVYSGDTVYMPAVTGSQTVNVSSGVANCPVTSFAASSNPVPLTGAGSATDLTINAPCAYDVYVSANGSAGQLFGSGSGSTTLATGNWVSDDMVFTLYKHGDTSTNGFLASLTVNMASPASSVCTVHDFEAAPNPVKMSASSGATTILVNASCPYDVHVGATSGALLGTGSGLAQFQTGPAQEGEMIYLQLRGDQTAQGTLQTLSIRVVP